MLLLPLVALLLYPHFFVIELAVIAVPQVALSRSESKMAHRAVQQIESQTFVWKVFTKQW